jgi:putative two-component system response regulator
MLPVDRMPRQVLVVDDDFSVAFLLRQLLEGEGFHVVAASNGLEALDRIAEHAPDLILLDLDMPHLGGYEVCRRVKQAPATRLVPILILTGQSSTEARLRAWELGADEFLTKPFQTVEVLARCRSLLQLKRLTDALDSAEAVVFALARTVEAKNAYTLGHSERVGAYALALAERLGLSQAERQTLRRAAMLHDVGKLSIPDAILNKPGGLTDEEFVVVKQHPVQGVRIVEGLRSIRDTLPLIRWHHERLDGQGYPDGIAADTLPRLVRVLSVADVYDALTSERPYRPALPHEKSMHIMRRDAASGGLDPELVESFSGIAGLPDPMLMTGMGASAPGNPLWH